MFKTNANISDRTKFLVSSLALGGFGTVLVIFAAFLYPQFLDLVKALTSARSTSIWFYGLGWIVTLLYGILWLCFFLMFEAAKAELLALVRK